MKICPNCRQTYNDNNLNFCLNDGGLLAPYAGEEPKTIFMDATRVTNQTTWPEQQSAPPPAPWGGPQNMTPPPAYQPAMTSPSQTLPTVSLVLGIFAILLTCCWGGIPFGAGAVIAGVIGMNQEKSDPQKYGGRGLALGGIITGAIGLLFGFVMIVLALIGNLK